MNQSYRGGAVNLTERTSTIASVAESLWLPLTGITVQQTEAKKLIVAEWRAGCHSTLAIHMCCPANCW